MSYWSFLDLHIVLNLCFTTRRVNKFPITLLKNWGPLLETILSDVPNWIFVHTKIDALPSHGVRPS
jgi:hypothetical protein